MNVGDVIQYGAMGILVLWSYGAYKIASGYVAKLNDTLDRLANSCKACEVRSVTIANGVGRVLRKTERIEVALDLEPTAVRSTPPGPSDESSRGASG